MAFALSAGTSTAHRLRTTERVPPLALYRLQLNSRFGFDQASEVLPYLRNLGVSHVYLSPVFQAAAGSDHGYDVVHHAKVSEQLGGDAAFQRFCMKCKAHDLGIVLDVVPNHMSISSDRNEWWMSVLEDGQASPYAEFFDVDWDLRDQRQQGKVLMPILGDHYGVILDQGGIRLEREGAKFRLRVNDRVLPTSPESVGFLLQLAAETYASDSLAFFADSFRELPHAADAQRMVRLKRARNWRMLESALANEIQKNADVRAALDDVVGTMNRDVALLDKFLDCQHYRLAYWKAAQEEPSYRRFFDITELAALRMDNRAVFDAVHARLIEWSKEGRIDGLRIDHIDGLRDPATYLEWLRTEFPQAWIVVEKICAFDEDVPVGWPIQGTTGYEFAAYADGLFVDREGEPELTELAARFGGHAASFFELARDCKMLVLKTTLASDLSRCVGRLRAVCEKHREYRDYSDRELRQAIAAFVACSEVYRTYPRADRAPSREEELRVLAAKERALEYEPRAAPRLIEFIADVLLGKFPGECELDFATRMQQLSSPATAKGVEDTAFFRHVRLITLNEVGSDPDRFGITTDEFHGYCLRNQHRRPLTLLASSTHDTKRSEDVRLRIALLSAHPSEWKTMLEQWPIGELDPIRYTVCQTLVGAWPVNEDRLQAYAMKCAREAKLATSWQNPSAEYEESLRVFVQSLLGDATVRRDIESFLQKHEQEFQVHSLGATLLKLTAPGVPDIYQGCELHSFSLTDPDNRRAVDFSKMRDALGESKRRSLGAVWPRAEEGIAKLWLVARTLEFRREHPDLFSASATYEPLRAAGPNAENIVPFVRSNDVAVAVPRLWHRWKEDRGKTQVSLPRGRWRNVFTGGELTGGNISASDLWRNFPVLLAKRIG